MRILVHPGFHKTGTSSMQRGVQARLARLEAHLRFLNTSDLLEATRAARRYSVRRDPLILSRFAETFAEALSGIDRADGRALLMSSEDLSGQIPGANGVEAYDAAPALLNVATACLHETFGREAGVKIWFTTRAPEAWTRSAYYQNLRAHRITEAFEAYRPRLERAARLTDIVEKVRARLAGRADVYVSAIEDCGTRPLGPLGDALALLDIPTDGIAPLPAQNVQPEGAVDALLALNRSDLDETALAEAKRQRIQSYWRQGRTRRAPPQEA